MARQQSIFRCSAALTAALISLTAALPQHTHAQTAQTDRAYVVVDQTGSGPCTFNGAPCPPDKVIVVAVELVPLAQAQAAGQPYIAGDVSPARINAFSAPIAQNIIARHTAAYRARVAQDQTSVIRPDSACPTGQTTDHVIYSLNGGSVHWDWTYTINGGVGTNCNELADHLSLSPNTGTGGQDRVDGGQLFTTNPYNPYDAGLTSNGGACDFISSNPVINGFSRSAWVTSSQAPETEVDIYADACNTNVNAYATVLW